MPGSGGGRARARSARDPTTLTAASFGHWGGGGGGGRALQRAPAGRPPNRNASRGGRRGCRRGGARFPPPLPLLRGLDRPPDRPPGRTPDPAHTAALAGVCGVLSALFPPSPAPLSAAAARGRAPMELHAPRRPHPVTRLTLAQRARASPLAAFAPPLRPHARNAPPLHHPLPAPAYATHRFARAFFRRPPALLPTAYRRCARPNLRCRRPPHPSVAARPHEPRLRPCTAGRSRRALPCVILANHPAPRLASSLAAAVAEACGRTPVPPFFFFTPCAPCDSCTQPCRTPPPPVRRPWRRWGTTSPPRWRRSWSRRRRRPRCRLGRQRAACPAGACVRWSVPREVSALPMVPRSWLTVVARRSLRCTIVAAARRLGVRVVCVFDAAFVL